MLSSPYDANTMFWKTARPEQSPNGNTRSARGGYVLPHCAQPGRQPASRTPPPPTASTCAPAAPRTPWGESLNAWLHGLAARQVASAFVASCWAVRVTFHTDLAVTPHIASTAFSGN